MHKNYRVTRFNGLYSASGLVNL